MAFTGSLDEIEVATPCKASWDDMKGTERVRFCELCRLNVYNLSGMTRDEAQGLVSGAEGRLCARFYRRRDGTVISEDCPVGLAARARKRVFAAAAGFAAFLGISGVAAAAAPDAGPYGSVIRWVAKRLGIGSPVRVYQGDVMGRIALPPPRPQGSR